MQPSEVDMNEEEEKESHRQMSAEWESLNLHSARQIASQSTRQPVQNFKERRVPKTNQSVKNLDTSLNVAQMT